MRHHTASPVTARVPCGRARPPPAPRPAARPRRAPATTEHATTSRAEADERYSEIESVQHRVYMCARTNCMCITRGTPSAHPVTPPLLLLPGRMRTRERQPARRAPSQRPRPKPLLRVGSTGPHLLDGRCGRLKRRAAHARINSRQSRSMQTLSPCRPIRPAEARRSV